MGLKYYIIDLESNGLKVNWHEVTEISVIRYEDRNQLTKQIKSEHPERSNEQALQITGRTIIDIMKGESKAEIVKQFNKFFNQDGGTPEHRCMVAHNGSFDRRFSHALWESVGDKFPANFWLDTIKMSKQWVKKIGKAPENYKLGTIIKFAGIKGIQSLHDAESDTRNTYLLFHKMKEAQIEHIKLIERHNHILSSY